MRKIELSENGPKVSEIIAGFWRLNDWHYSTNELSIFVNKLIDKGITTTDHADIYGNYTCEEKFGEVLKINPELRTKIEIVTKCGIKLISENRPQNIFHGYDTTKKHIISSAEKSLKNFNTDFIDVLLIHRVDPLMNADEVASAFYELKKSGKVKHFGVSNFTKDQFSLLQSRLEFKLVTNQIEMNLFNMFHMDNGDLDYFQKKRLRPTAWSPLAGGRIFNDNSEQGIRIKDELNKIADELNTTTDVVALAWILKHPARVIPVLGSGKIERYQSALELDKISLTNEQWFRLWTASKGHEVL